MFTDSADELKETELIQFNLGANKELYADMKKLVSRSHIILILHRFSELYFMLL